MNLTKEEPTNQIILGFYIFFQQKNVFFMCFLTANIYIIRTVNLFSGDGDNLFMGDYSVEGSKPRTNGKLYYEGEQ